MSDNIYNKADLDKLEGALDKYKPPKTNLLIRGCKTHGTVTEWGFSLFHCGDTECKPCNEWMDAMKKEIGL